MNPGISAALTKYSNSIPGKSQRFTRSVMVFARRATGTPEAVLPANIGRIVSDALIHMDLQGAYQRTCSIPKNLDANANEQKGRKPQNNAHAAFADDGGEAVRESIAKIDTYGYQSGTNHRSENREEIRAEVVRLIGTERDGHGDRARPNRERESERVEGAAKNIAGIHFFLDFGAAVHFLFAFQHGPAIGNNNQAAADMHDGNGDSEKMQNVRADDERGDQQDKTVQGDMPRQDAAHRVSILSREGEKHGTAAERIDDRKQSGEDEQDTFGDFQGSLRRGEYSRGGALADFLKRGVHPPTGGFG